jgi:predicted phosphodiesterase
LDVFETKDHILVTVPDGNLSAYTDAAERYGALGAPSSTLVADWTWEQIRELKMTRSAFGRVLTLAEAVSLCAGRCMVYVNVSGADDWTDTLLYQAFVNQNAAKSYFIPNPDSYTLTEPKTVTALRKWMRRDRSNSGVTEAYNYWTACVAKKPNHWSRLLWKNSGNDDSATWQSLRDEWKTFLYTADIAAYCDYIGKTQSASTKTDDVSTDQPYTINQSDLGYRVMILSDTHYYTTSNIKEDNLGISRAKKKEFLMGQIRKEIDGRGLDAILVLGDLATDNWTVGLADAKSDAEMYTKNTYYAKTLYDDCFKPFENELGIYVLAGNHDSFLNEKWKEMFGTDRQFSFKIGNMAFIMLDTFSDQGSNSKSNGTSYVGIDKTWLASEMAKYRNCKVVVCSHYFNSMKELKELSDQYSNIIGFYHGHTHLYEAVDVGNGTMCINDGGFSYTAFASEGGEWNFEYLDPRSAWGYCILEWTADNSRCVSYRTTLAITNVNYRNLTAEIVSETEGWLTYTIARERKTADIPLS